jgi:dTDP-glucose 4,6-dehydratase
VYNIGGGFELSNLELARRVCAYLGVSESLIGFVPDRPGHDFRYGLVWERLSALGWAPATPFDEGLAITLAWYRENRAWVDAVLDGGAA